MSKTALIVGSTGLVGEKLLELLLEDDYYQHVISVTRREEERSNSKYENLVVDFDQLEKYSSALKADDIFCCLGTTMKKAGSKEKFKKVDYQYPLDIAEITKKNGASGYFLISANGADSKSSFFYNRVKGDVESSIERVGFESYHIFRPAVLLGNRDESRPGESIAQFFFKLFDFLLLGPLKKFRGVKYDKVARAMIDKAKENKSGKHIHESYQMQRY